MDLIDNINKILAGLILLAAVVKIISIFIKAQFDEDINCKKRITNVAVCTIVAEVLVGVLPALVEHYY